MTSQWTGQSYDYAAVEEDDFEDQRYRSRDHASNLNHIAQYYSPPQLDDVRTPALLGRERTQDPAVSKRASTNKQTQRKSVSFVAQAECQHEATHDAPAHHLWQSYWLKKRSLILLFLLFTLLWIGLLLLRYFDRTNNGIRLTLTRNQYAWKYGPTAILVVVVSIWRQVDYHCKTLQPWKNLREGPAPASKTVLLDYISAFQGVAWYKAVKHRDMAVAMSILGFVMLKVIVVLSTGLLDLSIESLYEPNILLEKTMAFHGIAPNDTLLSNHNDPVTFDAIEGLYAKPVQFMYGVLRDNLYPPSGVINGMVTELFNQPEQDKEVSSMRAVVQVFLPKAHCEVGRTSSAFYNFVNDTETTNSFTAVSVTTPTCHLPAVNIGSWGPGYSRGHHVGEKAIMVSGDYLNCSEVMHDEKSGAPLPWNVDVGDWRWVMSMADISYVIASANESESNTSEIIREYHSTITILCDIDYTMANTTVMYMKPDVMAYSPIEDPTIPDEAQLLQGFSASELNKAVARAMSSASSGTALADLEAIQAGLGGSGVGVFFALVNASSTQIGMRELFENPSEFASTAEQVLNQVSQYFVWDSLLGNARTSIIGNTTYLQDRLHVREASVWPMFAFFIVLSLLCLSLIWTRPHQAVPCDPTTLATNAAILHASTKSLRSALAGIGQNSDKSLGQELNRYYFHTKVTKDFVLDAISRLSVVHETTGPSKRKAQDPWTPFTVRYPMLTLTFLGPLLAIILLEILYRVSVRNDGIASVNSSSSETVTHYLTSLLMLGIATLFNMLDFTVATFAPFSRLRAGAVSGPRGLTKQYLGNTPLLTLLQTLRDRQFGPTFSNLAALFGSLLTIFASGLWLFDHQSIAISQVALIRMDTWANSSALSTMNSTATEMTFSLMMQRNQSEPRLTYHGLALPKMRLSDISLYTEPMSLDLYSEPSEAGPTYSATVPSLRGNLRCDIVPSDRFYYTFPINQSFSQAFGNFLIPAAVVDLPQGCVDNSGYDQILLAPDIGSIFDEGVYLGQMLDVSTEYRGNVTNSTSADRSRGCPSIAFIYGYAKIGSYEQNSTGEAYELMATQSAPENMTVLLCYQELQQVMAKVNFTLENDTTWGVDDTGIRWSTEYPPQSLESNVTYRQNETDGTNTFHWPTSDMFKFFQQTTSQKNSTAAENLSFLFDGSTEYEPLSPIFDYLLKHGNGNGSSADDKDTYDFEKYMRPSNIPRLIEDINTVWRRYMAQAIHTNMRIQLPAPSTTRPLLGYAEPRTILATAHTAQTRMKVNQTSKIILQSLLAAMITCGLVAAFTTRIRHTLPHEPCSIAGTMTLLADSELVERMPRGAEWMSPREMRTFLDKSGWEAGLGWWDYNTTSSSSSSHNRAQRGETRSMHSAIEDAEDLLGNEEGNEKEKMRFGIDIGDSQTFA